MENEVNNRREMGGVYNRVKMDGIYNGCSNDFCLLFHVINYREAGF